MKKNRRKFLKDLSFTVASASFPFASQSPAWGSEDVQNKRSIFFRDDFENTSDRIWIGNQYWAIPMEDWRIKSGRIECIGHIPNSRVNLLTYILNNDEGDFNFTVDAGLIGNENRNKMGSVGFNIGVQDKIDSDVKAACYYGKGISAGVSLGGKLFLGDQVISLASGFDFSKFSLAIKGISNEDVTVLTLNAVDKKGNVSEVSYKAPKETVGLLALVNNFKEENGANFWFKNLSLIGNKLDSKPENSFGPILWTMYTLSKRTLKVMAQMPPVGDKDNQTVELQLKKNGDEWKKSAIQEIHSDSNTVHFKINSWDHKEEVPYQIVYKNNGERFTYSGIIRQEPTNESLDVGALTCQEWGGFPYTPLVDNLQKRDPDLLFFSGDQLYENNGGYPIKRKPDTTAIHSYLGKWYMFGWAFKDLMKDRPTICTPDDHDVFQGNIWGEGGRALSLDKWKKSPDDHGGYVQTPRMVNVVHKTQCGHLPDSACKVPLYSGIQPWYTDLVYGEISFAIISDRMFKSGPEMVRSGKDRLDHIKKVLKEGELEDRNLTFLGHGQMEFLENWVQNWEGVNMKVLLSQTLFCNAGTHHGSKKMFLVGDMDSGGWPQQRRDEVIQLLRKACVFHINGDQHLPFIVQYGIDEPRDGGWAYCTPAISTGYPRWGQPDLVGAPFTDRPSHGLPNTGVYKDGFGNSNFIYAVGNPLDEYYHKNRYQQAQNKSSGFGIIQFNTKSRSIKMNAYRFLASKEKSLRVDQFPGWPLTILQTDNDGRKPVAFLPKLVINKPDQVVKIIDENSNEIVSIYRVKGFKYQPKVFSKGPFTIEVGEGEVKKLFQKNRPMEKKINKTLKVTF